MSRAWSLAGAVVLLSLHVVAQPTPRPDLGPVMGPIDDVAGQVVPPVVSTAYAALGQNITREDIRIHADLNFTSGGVGLLGLLLGSGKAQVEASVYLRLEMRVLSSERIRAALEGRDAYNITADNATWMTDLYIPAEVFRASVTAEALAAFQDEQELALRRMLASSLPELEIISLDLGWKNTLPLQVVTDVSLTEPPIILELDSSVRYLRVESIPSLLQIYFEGRKPPDDPEKLYIQRLKEDNGDALTARNFYAAAAYTQLLNLSLQPGWSLDFNLAVPRGYSFEYANQNFELLSERRGHFKVDATGSDDDVQEVLLVSMTHRRAVAAALFAVMMVYGALVVIPLRFLYGRYRLPKVRERATAQAAKRIAKGKARPDDAFLSKA